MTGNKTGNTPPNLDELIPLSLAAEFSELSHSHLRLLLRDGEIEGRKMGRDWFTTLRAVRVYEGRIRKLGPKVPDQIKLDRQ